jgi:predicted tellurium resistance membrane protein TerC
MAEFLYATYGHLASVVELSSALPVNAEPTASGIETISTAILSPLPEFCSIVIAEILFSLDNFIHVENFARALPERERIKAMRWGLSGALFLRALSLVLMTIAKSYYWIMLVGSIHLLITASLWFLGLNSEAHEKKSLTVPVTKSMSFLKAIVMIEIADFCFSIDNVAVAVSISQNIWVSTTAVALGVVIVRLSWRNLKYWSMCYPRLIDTSQLVAGMLGLQTLAKLVLHLQISPWLDLAIVAAAISLGLTVDTRTFGTKLRKKATLLLIAILMCLLILLKVFFNWH